MAHFGAGRRRQSLPRGELQQREHLQLGVGLCMVTMTQTDKGQKTNVVGDIPMVCHTTPQTTTNKTSDTAGIDNKEVALSSICGLIFHIPV
jgi:hypothetical protein